jgi:hypothetical protein
MPETLMWAAWSVGTTLSRSHKKPGNYSSNLRGRDRNNAGQVTLRTIDESESGYIVNCLLTGAYATSPLARLMWVTWNDGEFLSRSQLRPGAYSPLTRDRDGHLVGQATLRDIEAHEVGYIVDCLRQHSAVAPRRTERGYAGCGAAYGAGGTEVKSTLGRDLLDIAIDAFAEAVGSTAAALGHELVGRLAHSFKEWALTKFANPTASRPRPDPEHRRFVDHVTPAKDMHSVRDQGSLCKDDLPVEPAAPATAA